MSQLFPPSMNIMVRITLLGGVFILAGLVGSIYYFLQSPLMTGVGLAKEQPVPFSHRQHTGGLGLDCRYCHTSVEETDFAGIPPTETCLGCHAQVLPDAPLLEAVRTSSQNNQPLKWIRVHDLADFVYFNHGIHISKGVGCESCHGRVDQMSAVAKMETLRMDWCLACHRAPEQFVRPPAELFTMGWEPPSDHNGLDLIAEYGIEVEQLTDCSICHR